MRHDPEQFNIANATPVETPADVVERIGVYPGLSNAEYHGGPGISKSGLDIIRRSPLHFKHSRQAVRVSTPAQRIGTAVHDLILEPESFWDRYAIPLDPADFPDAVKSRDELVEMVEVLNLDRLPKLSSSGSKQELIDRIIEAGATKNA